MASKTVTFESKYGAYAVVRSHKLQLPSPTGIGYQTTQKGLTYQFQPVPSPRGAEGTGLIGVLTVKVGQDKMVDNEDWLREGEDPEKVRDAVDALMANRAFGSDFWLQGHAPGTLYPRPQDFRQQVTLATAKLDDEGLAEMIAKERSSHGRVDLIEEAENALQIVSDAIASEQAAAKPAPKQKAAV